MATISETTIPQLRSLRRMPDSYSESSAAPYCRLALDTSELLGSLPAPLLSRQIKTDQNYDERSSKNGRFTLRTWSWEILCLEMAKANPLQHGTNDRVTDLSRPDGLEAVDSSVMAEFRLVLIEGSANTIINAWCFPTRPQCCPVFAAELIAIAHAPKLTFLDIQAPALTNQIERAVIQGASKQVRNQFAELRISESPPEWATSESLGEYLFGRAMESSSFPQITAAYLRLLQQYFNLLSSRPRSEQLIAPDPSALAEMNKYQLHHMHSSPGKQFLGKVFGADWTDEFLENFLFSLPGAVR